MNTYHAVRACSLALLRGDVLSASDVTAGRGIVIDWRTVKSGSAVTTGADAFDTARSFVALIGTEAALGSLDVAPTQAPESFVATRVVQYCVSPSCGGRRRSFESPQGFTVYVEPDADDATQAHFTARLAAFCDAEQQSTAGSNNVLALPVAIG